MNTTAPRPMPAVLLVDDDEFVCDLMCEMLRHLGITVVHQAGDGRQALAVLGALAQPPEFLICDIYMPDMDGIEFVAELARLHYGGGVILLSGVNPETLQLARDIALGEGINLVGAFVKPVQPEALAQALGLDWCSTMPDAGRLSLDRIDLKILQALQCDGRVSNLKLAETVALSPTAVLARVQRLTKDGLITGYEVRLDATKLGVGLMVFVEVLLDKTTPNVFEAFKAAVQVYPEIMECHMVAGGFDYLLKTRMSDMNAYREFAGSVLWQLPGVRETRTYAVMEEVKNTTRLPLK